jgi:hypothetical protein
MELYSTQLLATLPSSCEWQWCEKVERYWDGEETCVMQRVIWETDNENNITRINTIQDTMIQKRIKEKWSNKYIFNKSLYDFFEEKCL